MEPTKSVCSQHGSQAIQWGVGGGGEGTARAWPPPLISLSPRDLSISHEFSYVWGCSFKDP